MYGINEIVLVGDINKEPETKTHKNLLITEFIIHIKRKYHNRDGELLADVQDIKVGAFGRTAEYARDNLDIGDRVCVKARLRGRTWEGKHYVDVSAYDITRLTEGTGKPEKPAPATTDDEDDLPF